MEVIYSLTLTLWTIIKITVSNPLLLATVAGSLLTIFIKRYAKS